MTARRLIGAALVAGSGLWAGQMAKQKLLRRARLLEGFAAACALMKSEVAFLHTPPEEMLAALAQESRPESGFFRLVLLRLKRKEPLARAWRAVAEETLTGAERDELVRLGEALSRYDLEGAVAHLSAASEKFNRWAKEAGETAKNDGKLQFTLWAMGGCLAAILLL